MSEHDLTAAILLDAAARRGDPLERFIATLNPEYATHARDSVRKAHELVHHTQALLSCSDVRESLRHAEWLARYAREVAYQYTSIKQAAVRWAEIDGGHMAVRLQVVPPPVDVPCKCFELGSMTCTCGKSR